MVKSILQALFGLAVIASTNAIANDESPHLSIVTEHLAPFQIVEKDSIGGLSTEIVEATLNAAGFQYTLDLHPWSVSFKRARQEKNTCIYSLVRLPIREEQFQWVGHIAHATSSFYSLKSRKDINIPNVEDAKNFITAVIQDDITHQFLLSKGFIENQHFYASSNYDALLRLLEVPSRNIDLVIINDELIYHRLNSTEDVKKYTNLLNIEELKLDFNFACGLNTEKSIVTKLGLAMRTLEENGSLNEIRESWRSKMIYSH